MPGEQEKFAGFSGDGFFGTFLRREGIGRRAVEVEKV